MSHSKVMVTGGAGFIGSHLARLLDSKGYDVTVYDDLSNSSGKKNLPDTVRLVRAGITNQKKMESAFKSADLVFNLAVMPLLMSFTNPERVVRVNDYGTYLVAKVCSKLGIKLVHVSSSEAYGTAKYSTMSEGHPLLPTTVYAASKAASEAYVRGFGQSNNLEFVIVRPFNSYGQYMSGNTYSAATPKFYARLSKGRPPVIFGSGNQTRDLTYVEDTARGIFLAGIRDRAVGGTFNIAQGKETPIKSMAKIMIKKYNELTGKNLNLDLEFRAERKGDVRRHLADISLAKKKLNYSPTVNLEEGITKYLKWKLEMK